MKLSSTSGRVALAACLATGATTAPAQTSTAPRPQSPGAAISLMQIDNYAAAFVELNKSRRKLAENGTTAPAERRQSMQAAQEQETAILARHNLDPATFNRISKAVETNPAIQSEIKQQMMSDLMSR